MLAITAWHWFILACALFIIEILIGTEFLLWLGIATSISALVAYLFPELSIPVQLSLYAFFIVASLITWKKIARPGQKTDQPNLNQRNKQYVGRIFELVEPIKNGVGKVIVDDTQWKVSGDDAPKGSSVKVTGTNGTILIVEKLTTKKPAARKAKK